MRYVLFVVLFFIPVITNAADPDFGVGQNWSGYVASTSFSGTGSGQWSVSILPQIVNECDDLNSGQIEYYYWNGSSWVGILGGTGSCSSLYSSFSNGFSLTSGRTYVKFMRSPFPGTGSLNQNNADGYIYFTYTTSGGIEIPSSPNITNTRIIQVNEPSQNNNEVTVSTTVDFDVDYLSGTPTADTICLNLSNLTTYQSLTPICESIVQSGILNFATSTVLQSQNYYNYNFVIYDSNNQIIDETQTFGLSVEYPQQSPLNPANMGNPYSVPQATSSTSTLAEMTMECDPNDTFFSRSVCNLAILLFVPSNDALVYLNSTLQTVLQKQPFQTFYEFRTAYINSTRTSTVSDSSFSLVVYGETIPIIATSTMYAFANETVFDSLRYLIAVALWILFGWWAFNRINILFSK